jgi:hypothetical protein
MSILFLSCQARTECRVISRAGGAGVPARA